MDTIEDPLDILKQIDDAICTRCQNPRLAGMEDNRKHTHTPNYPMTPKDLKGNYHRILRQITVMWWT